ncbi:MAG: TIM barrel protein [Smithellaceae bacterium]|nr:TIM barrel protein [Smithellaceae bacterium]
MKYSLCIENFYQDLSFEDKFAAAKGDGFEYCEFWTWQNRDWEGVKKAIADSGIKIAAFSGDDEYSLINPDEKSRYVEFLRESLAKAKEIDCPYLVIHSDALNKDGSAKEIDRPLSDEVKLLNMYKVLEDIAPFAEKEEVTLVLEPLNTRVGQTRAHKNYFLAHPRPAFELTRQVGSDRVKVLYDIYHMQLMAGNVIKTLEENMDQLGYLHLADVPGSHEPGTGELNCGNILKALDSLGYDGFVGFELLPAASDDLAIKAIKAVWL